jgi:F-type H+-transporting ATPase subunit delta
VADEAIARRYATAIFGLAQERGAVEEVGRDLRAIFDAIASDDTVQRFFFAPVINRKEKTQIITDAFARSVHQIALHSVLLLIRKRREPLEIVSARELGRDDIEALVDRLSRLYKTRFVVTQRVDPGLIGGIRITMGDRRIDGSIAGRLNDLARALSKN